MALFEDRLRAAASLRECPRTRRAVAAGMSAGLHFGAQVYATIDGQVVCDLAMGRLGPEGAPVTSDSALPWWSSIKPALAVLLGVAVDRGYVASFRSPVAAYLPEFGTRGKAALTFEDILTHTSGLVVAGAAEAHGGAAWDDVLRATCDGAPEWTPPGTRLGYSMGGAFHCVAEALRRAWGDQPAPPYAELLRREVFAPLGLHDCCYCGVPPEARLRDFPATFELSQGVVADDGSNAPEALASSDPSGAGRGPARGLAVLFSRLLADTRDGTVDGRLLAAPTARALTKAVYPKTQDLVQGLEVNAGMAMYVAPKFAGPSASPRTFGHGGSRSSFGLADPDFGLAVGVIFNGRPGSDAHYARCEAVMAGLYADLFS